MRPGRVEDNYRGCQPRWQRVRRAAGDWGGYWGQKGRGFLDDRRAAYDGEQRMVFGATRFGLFAQLLPAIGDDERDPWMDRHAALLDHRGLLDPAGHLRLARRDRRQR